MTNTLSKIKFVGCLLLLIPALVFADDPKARAIMEKVDARDTGDNIKSDMEMILIDKRGNERIRKIHSMTKDFGEDTYRIMFFEQPADVKNTGFLTYDYDDPDKDDDQWLYLPALKKSKRIATSDKSGSFMGSDFSYSDMTKRNLKDYDYTLQKEMKVDGHDVWIIESIPRTEDVIDETGYTKTLVFVRKDNYVVIRSVSWLKTGRKLKFFEVTKLEKIDGIWTNREMTMTTKRGKTTLHKTIMRFNNLQYNQNIDENVFTVRRLEKGL
ncbi:MAG: outer membrane lipoprotein-sorting protein [Gammaproteobacteria bacterium]|nr:outer membrane lipoprotein-sorting protein [Gammaproteobacteria bacterium]